MEVEGNSDNILGMKNSARNQIYERVKFEPLVSNYN